MSPSLSPTGVPLVGLRLVSINTYDCLQWTLTYECTVMGGPGGATVWTGTALDCLSDEIVLLHQGSTYEVRYCNNGTTVTQSLSVQDNLYTSQLSVTVTYDVAGKMIIYDSDTKL